MRSHRWPSLDWWHGGDRSVRGNQRIAPLRRVRHPFLWTRLIPGTKRRTDINSYLTAWATEAQPITAVAISGPIAPTIPSPQPSHRPNHPIAPAITTPSRFSNANNYRPRRRGNQARTRSFAGRRNQSFRSRDPGSWAQTPWWRWTNNRYLSLVAKWRGRCCMQSLLPHVATINIKQRAVAVVCTCSTNRFNIGKALCEGAYVPARVGVVEHAVDGNVLAIVRPT